MTDTDSILYKIGQAVKTAGQSGSILGLSDTPSSYDPNKPNLKVNAAGTGLEFIGDTFVIDGEFRGMMTNLLHHRPFLQITAGDEHDITNINDNQIVWKTPNGTLRNLQMSDEYGQGGNDYFIRIDGGEPTCDGGGSYDKETNTCFPNSENVIAASTFQGVYDPDLATNASGSYSYSAKIRILKTGLYAKGWIDVHQMYHDLYAQEANIASNLSDIANLGAEVAALQSGGGGSSAATYTKATLPLNGNSADLALVTDGTLAGTPTMSYFYQGKWYRSFDNSLITDQTIDIYLLAGQSNAHGQGLVSDLDEDQKTQDGLFYTSWHNRTSNASSAQYYSPWASSLVAGNTRGDSNSSTIGGSTMFGPELGFVERANTINLTDGQPIGVLKHAIGASALTDDGSADGGLSDWDLTATGDNRGDALRAFKLAIADGLTKLTNTGYSYRLAGMIWWQGESGGADSDLIAFIDHMRTWLDDNYTLDMPKVEFPFVITGTTDYWRTTYKANVADKDSYIGFVNSQELASPDWADRTLVHPGSDGSYQADAADIARGYTGSVGDTVGSPDFKGDGVNDMFTIGRAYADEMQLAITGSTNSVWTPSSISTRLWLDMDDQTTLTSSGGNVTSIADKSGNNYTFNASSNSTLESVNAVQNGKNILRFNGNTDYTNSTLTTFATYARHKWFFVLKTTNIDNTLDSWVYVNSSGKQHILMGSSGQTFKGFWYNKEGFRPATSTTDLNNSWNILSVEWDEVNDTATTWLNGTQQDTGTGSGTIGGNKHIKFNKYAQIGDSDWGEAIFVEDASQTNSEKIEGYLAHKWGLISELPSNHPYKSSAP